MRALSAWVAAAPLLLSMPARAFCPCYSLSSSYNDANCGVEAQSGTNPTVQQWQDVFATVSRGKAAWGTGGPAVGSIGQGCGKPEPLHSVAAQFPCELLKAIAMQESSWKQFCVPDRPADEVGGASRTIISFDCGYGVGQVTSGMHVGETPSFDRLKVASSPLYNLATGATILAGKWKATNCVGDNQPSIVEDWYSATWAYNGLSYKNNPNNPNYDPGRGVWNPQVGGAAPYQEHVFGWVQHPPTTAHWTGVKLAYPKLVDVGGSSSPPTLPEPSCASPTSCASTRPAHVSVCFAGSSDGGVDAGVDGGEPADAGGLADAGEAEDAGGDAGADAGAPPVTAELLKMEGLPRAETGCGCGVTESASIALWAGALWLLRARRRR